jgi:hypothetical protein
MAEVLSGVSRTFYPGFEQKIYSETDGLVDLVLNSTLLFSPNRQIEARRRIVHLWDRASRAWLDSHPERRNVYLSLLEAFRSLAQSVPQGLWDADALIAAQQRVRAFHEEVLLVFDRKVDEVDIYVDDTPQTLLNADVLLQLLPGALFLEVVRDPSRVASSLVSMSWGPDDITTAARWVADYDVAARRAVRLIPASSYLRVRLEDIGADRDSAAKQLSAFMSLSVEPERLQKIDVGHANSRSPLDDSGVHEDVRQRLKSVATAWGYG